MGDEPSVLGDEPSNDYLLKVDLGKRARTPRKGERVRVLSRVKGISREGKRIEQKEE